MRFIAIGILAAFFPIAIHHRLRAHRMGDRLNRRNEGIGLMAGLRLAGALAAAATWGAFQDAAWTQPFDFDGGWVTGAAGLLLEIASTLWLVWMFRTLGTNLTDTVETRASARFVCDGPYRFIRNPMYAGVLGLTVSLGLVTGNALPALFGMVVFAFMAIRTPIEERFLVARFGDTYWEYMLRVPRFVPRRVR